MMDKELKSEISDEELILDDLSDLIEELSELISEDECSLEITKTTH